MASTWRSPRRECVALIGANGAGKSSTLKAICGLVPVAGGSVHFEGRDITNASGHAVVRSGITMCPEGRQVFPQMSVIQNLRMGAYARRDKDQDADLERMMDMLIPDPAGTSDAGSGQALRRRAGDAGHCASADGATAHLPLRRAISGPGSQDRRQCFRDAGTDQGHGHDDPAGRAEFDDGPQMADRAYLFEAGKVVLEGPAKT